MFFKPKKQMVFLFDSGIPLPTTIECLQFIVNDLTAKSWLQHQLSRYEIY